jgi:hypothetical protein
MRLPPWQQQTAAPLAARCGTSGLLRCYSEGSMLFRLRQAPGSI